MPKSKTSPKKIKIKDHCSIAGLVKDKIFGPGLYIVGKNIDQETFELLKSPKFAHAVEEYKEKLEALGEVEDSPKESPGDAHRRKLRNEELRKYQERWSAGRPAQTSID